MKLTVAGLGIKEVEQMTLETLKVIGKVTAVLVLPIVSDQTLQSITELTTAKVINLKSLYQDNTKDTENYERILEAVLSLMREYENVALLVPGHPRIGVTLVTLLEKVQAQEGFELNVLPGVSSFSTLINDLKIDPIERGTLLVDANRLLLFENKVDPCFNLFIYHVCSVGTAQISLDQPLIKNRLDLIKEFLIETYGQNHEVVLISSRTREKDTAVEVKTTVRDFEKCYSQIHYGTTLYVPSQLPSRINRSFLALIQGDSYASV